MARADLLIDAATLKQRLDEGSNSLVLLDCRFSLGDPGAGRRQWLQGHIRGASHADLDSDLSDLSQPSEQGRHPLPEHKHLARRLRDWGIDGESAVVVYDQGPSVMAARAWWLLRAVGIDNVRVLDGGLKAWTAAGGAVETADAAETVASEGVVGTECQLPRDRWLDNRQLSRALKAQSVALVDAREAARYRGEIEPIDPVAGHIPGALSRPVADNLDAEGCFLPADTLRLAFDQLRGVHAPKQVVHQCGSGVAACHNLLAMEIAGLHGSKLHAPSWSGWLAGGGEVAKGGP